MYVQVQAYMCVCVCVHVCVHLCVVEPSHTVDGCVWSNIVYGGMYGSMHMRVL